MNPYGILLGALTKARPGYGWSVDNWHQEAYDAGLTGSEKRGAQQQAVRDGYLDLLGDWIDGEFCPNYRATVIPAGKGRPVQVFRRTERELPGQTFRSEMPGQLALVEVTA